MDGPASLIDLPFSSIIARTRPNLFDLFVALFSAMAGAYAMIRGREGAIVGVAIATALMPPLAVVVLKWGGETAKAARKKPAKEG